MGHREQLNDSGHALRGVRLRRARRVEGVQCELGGGLSNGLGRQRAHHLAGVDGGLNVLELDLAEDLVKRVLGEAQPDDGLLGGQVEAEQDLEDLVVAQPGLGAHLFKLGHHVGGGQRGLG